MLKHFQVKISIVSYTVNTKDRVLTKSFANTLKLFPNSYKLYQKLIKNYKMKVFRLSFCLAEGKPASGQRG